MNGITNLFTTACLLSLSLPILAAEQDNLLNRRSSSENKLESVSAPKAESFMETMKKLEIFKISIAYSNEDAEVQYQQGLLYRDGKAGGVAKGSFESIQWAGFYFQEAAIKNHVKAMHNLAMIYYGKKRFDGAAYWFVKAAEKGFEPSIRNIDRLNKEKAGFNSFDLTDPYQFTACCLPSLSPFDNHGIPIEIYIKIAAVLSVRDLLALNQVDKRWSAVSQSELIRKVPSVVRVGNIQKALSDTLVDKNFSQAFELFEIGLDEIKKINKNYFTVFLRYADLTTRQQTVLFTEDGPEQKTLKEWSVLLHELRQHDAHHVDTLIRKHIKTYLVSGAPLNDKLQVINFINTPNGGSFPFNKDSNYYYQPAEAQQLLEDLISRLPDAGPENIEATLFVLGELSPFRRNDAQLTPGQEPPIPLNKMLLKHLADRGNHWQKILYVAHYANQNHTEPMYGEPITLEGLKDLLATDLNAQNFAIEVCKISLGKDFADNLGGLTADNEVVELLTRVFTKVIGYKTTNLIDLQKMLGYVGDPYQVEFIQPYMNELQNYLNRKSLYTPAFSPITEVPIQELQELTAQQMAIIKLLNERREFYKQPSIPFEGRLIKQNYGPWRTSGSITFTQGGLEVVGDAYAITTYTILNGPTYIKVKEFTLQSDFDALGGAVIVAEKFNINGGRIWNPQNCHLIQVSKVKLDKSSQISD